MRNSSWNVFHKSVLCQGTTSVVPKKTEKEGFYRLRKNFYSNEFCNKGTALAGPQAEANQRGL
jgi:hypothetical protein